MKKNQIYNNGKNFEELTTYFMTPSGIIRDRDNKRYASYHDATKVAETKDIVVLQSQPTSSVFHTFYSDIVRDDKSAAVKFDMWSVAPWNLSDFTSAPERQHLHSGDSLKYHEGNFDWSYWKHQIKFVYLNDDTTITIVYGINFTKDGQTAKLMYVVNPKYLVCQEPFISIAQSYNLHHIKQNNTWDNYNRAREYFAGKSAQEIKNFLLEIKDDSGQPWMIEINEGDLYEPTKLKTYGTSANTKVFKTIFAVYWYDMTSNIFAFADNESQKITYNDDLKNNAKNIHIIYEAHDVYRTTTRIYNTFSDSTMRDIKTVLENGDSKSKFAALLLRDQHTFTMPAFRDFLIKAEIQYNKISKAKEVKMSKTKSSVLTGEEAMEQLQFPENCLKNTVQRIGNVIYITGNTARAYDGCICGSYYFYNADKWVIYYDVEKLTKGIYARRYGKILKETLFERQINDIFALRASRYGYNVPNVGWKFVQPFDEIFKDTLIAYLKNCPKHIVINAQYAYTSVDLQNTCTEDGFGASSIKLLVTGVKPIFELLAKSQLYNMYALYTADQTVGAKGTFMKSKLESSFHNAANTPYAVIHKGKDLSTIFGLSMKQLRLYDAYLGKVMYDENNKLRCNRMVASLLFIEDIIAPMSKEEMHAKLMQINPDKYKPEMSDTDIIDAAFTENLQTQAVKMVDTKTFEAILDMLYKVSCDQSHDPIRRGQYMYGFQTRPGVSTYDISAQETLKNLLRPMKLIKRFEFFTTLLNVGDSYILTDYWRMRKSLETYVTTHPQQALGTLLRSMRESNAPQRAKWFDENGNATEIGIAEAQHRVMKHYQAWPAAGKIFMAYNENMYNGQIHYTMESTPYIDCLKTAGILPDDTRSQTAETYARDRWKEDLFLSSCRNWFDRGLLSVQYNEIAERAPYRYAYCSGRNLTPIDRDLLNSISDKYHIEYAQTEVEYEVTLHDGSTSIIKHRPIVGVMLQLTPSEMIRYLHDSLSAEIDAYQNEIQAAEFENSRSRFADLEYEDEKAGLSIIAPKTAAEVIQEGKTLSHCVGGYVKSIIAGASNILFIRKTDQIDQPYFTMEVSPNGQIRQIHSYQNHNVSEESQRAAYEVSGYSVYAEPKDIVSFLIKWAKAKQNSVLKPVVSSIRNQYGALCAPRA